MLNTKAQLLIRETSLGALLPGGYLDLLLNSEALPNTSNYWFDDFFTGTPNTGMMDSDLDSSGTSNGNVDVFGLPMTDWATQIPDL